MRTIFFFVFYLMFSCFAFSQNGKKFLQVTAYHEEHIKSFCDSLKKSGVENFVVYEKGCRGCWISYKFDYGSSRPNYIFWQVNQEWVVKKIDHYTDYKTLKLTEFSFFDYYLDNKTLMKNEKLFTFSTGIFDIDTVTGDTISELTKIFPSHSVYNRLIFNDSIESFEIYYRPDFGDFGIETKKYNMILKFDSLISQLELDKKFKAKNFNYYPIKIQRKWKKEEKVRLKEKIENSKEK